MYERAFVCDLTLIDDYSQKVYLVYFLTKGKAADGASIYGIAVEKRIAGNGGIHHAESENSGFVTDNGSVALGIIDILEKNTVTPCSLCCVVDEMLL